MYKFLLSIVIIFIVGCFVLYFNYDSLIQKLSKQQQTQNQEVKIDIDSENSNISIWSSYTHAELLNQLLNESWYKENKDMFRIIKLEDHYLILDSGTAPEPRTLTIYDLNKKQKVYSGLYSSPVEVSSSSVKFWSPTDMSNSESTITPTESNCPDMKKYTEMGLGVGIEKLSQFDLKTLTFNSSDTTRCSVRQ